VIGEWHDLGDGITIAYYGAEGEAVDGLLWRHDCPNDPRGPESGGDAVPFGPPFDANHWRVTSWVPLTLDGSLLCTACHRHGFIQGGKWHPA
jgi:hypothetical protein